ncbi:unnamed protein product [marine sediment metagenome]|uniref:Lipoprotein n=1 Tax=marine sediment metagenome TaxID=412755 RepID=X0YDJ7_9ZZZZ
MKKIAIFTILIILFAGCSTCVKYPDKPYNKKKGIWTEPPECYALAICEYYRAKREGKNGDCKAEFAACSKVRSAIRCMNISTQKGMKKDFNDCFNLLQ